MPGPGLLQLGVLCLCLIAAISYGLVLLVLDYEPFATNDRQGGGNGGASACII
jgi:hypothetical protein